MNLLSFQKDIAPIFVQFRDSMTWRLDLANYVDVKTNAPLILSQIQSGGGMPPPPYAPLTPAQISIFSKWMQQNCPP